MLQRLPRPWTHLNDYLRWGLRPLVWLPWPPRLRLRPSRRSCHESRTLCCCRLLRTDWCGHCRNPRRLCWPSPSSWTGRWMVHGFRIPSRGHGWQLVVNRMVPRGFRGSVRLLDPGLTTACTSTCQSLPLRRRNAYSVNCWPLRLVTPRRSCLDLPDAGCTRYVPGLASWKRDLSLAHSSQAIGAVRPPLGVCVWIC